MSSWILILTLNTGQILPKNRYNGLWKASFSVILNAQFKTDLFIDRLMSELRHFVPPATFSPNNHRHDQHAIHHPLQHCKGHDGIWLTNAITNGIICRDMSVVNCLLSLLFEYRPFHCMNCSFSRLFVSLFWWWEFGTHGDSDLFAFLPSVFGFPSKNSHYCCF